MRRNETDEQFIDRLKSTPTKITDLYPNSADRERYKEIEKRERMDRILPPKPKSEKPEQ